MHAQAVNIQFQAGKIDEASRIISDSLLPVLKAQKGFKSHLLIIQRDMSKAIFINLWESDTELAAFEASPLYRPLMDKLVSVQTEPPDVGRYEVDAPSIVEQLRIGDKDDSGENISGVYYKTEEWIVYSTSTSPVKWASSNPAITKSLADLVPDLSELALRADAGFRNNKGVRGEIARAVVLHGMGNAEGAKNTLKAIERRFTRITTLSGRLQYAAGSFMVVLALAIALAILLLVASNSGQKEFMSLFLTAVCGSLGGFLSVMLNLNKLTIDRDAPARLNIILGMSRILIAVIGAILVYLLVKANIVLGTIAQSTSPFAILAIGVVSGFSETLIPNLLRQVETQQ